MIGLPSGLSLKLTAIAVCVAFAAGGVAGWQARDVIADVAGLRAERTTLMAARDAALKAAADNAAAAKRLTEDRDRQEAALAALEAERQQLAADLDQVREAISAVKGGADPAGEALDRAFDALRKGAKP